ncbi:MAG TPA: serine hydrolase [Gemmatimonadota bacterium]|nr:serine hydrolase [Gemmatimonadota bacterium]
MGRAERDPAPAALPAPPPPAVPAALDSVLRGLESDAGGVLGVAGIHIESGRRIEWNGSELFPMASVVKLPIALAVLERVDAGRLALSDTIRIAPQEVRPGRSLQGAGPVTVSRLLELMLRESDNTAADALFAVIGGPGPVRDRLAALGVDGIDVSRTEGRMLSDWAGLPPPPVGRDWSGTEFYRLLDGVPPAARRRAAATWAADPRDAATPVGMADLLARVHEGAGLSAAGRRLLIGHMRRSYGDTRIPGLLPANTPAARKSGTVGATTNDVGIVSLPDGTHLALAVFIKSSDRPLAERERAIAGVSRALYDHFTGLRRWGIVRIYL